MSSGLWKYFVHFSRTDKIHGRFLQLGDQIRQPLGGFLGGLLGDVATLIVLLVAVFGGSAWIYLYSYLVYVGKMK